MAEEPPPEESLFERFESKDEDRRQIWTMRLHERAFYTFLPVRERLRFRLFSTRYKLEQSRVAGVISSSNDTIEAWMIASDNEKDRLVKESRKESSPYDAYIGQRFPLIYGQLSQDEAPDNFKACFFLGCAIYTLEWKTVHGLKNRELLDHILLDPNYNELWETEFKKEDFGNINRVVEWTHERFSEFLSPVIPPVASETKSHLDQSGVKAAPTRADEVHIAQDWAKLGLNLDDWFFERTMHSFGQDERSSRMIHLYSRVDDDGNLQQRTVVKITGFTEQPWAHESTMNEFWPLKHLSSLQPDCFIQCHGYSVRQRKNPMMGPTYLGYGYLEYAPYGDLWQLLCVNENESPNLPEFFIWYVFDTLARALVNLSWGESLPLDYTLPKDWLGMSNEQLRLHGKSKAWYTIINTDIKPENVVLADPGARYPHPTPKMIDFGLTYRAKHPQPHDAMYDFRSRHSNSFGTSGFEPPEQVIHGGLAGDPRVRAIAEKNTVGIHSEIFNVGLIIWNLMNKTMIRYNDHNGRYEYENLTKRADINYLGMYSSLLYDLTDQCIRMKVEERPTLAHLITRTRQGLQRSKNAFPGADPTGKSMEDLQPALQFPLKRPYQVGDFMGEGYRRLRSRVSEEGVKPPPPPPAHADPPDSSISPTPWAPRSPPINLIPPAHPILRTPPPPTPSPITPPRIPRILSKPPHPPGLPLPPVDPAPPALSFLSRPRPPPPVDPAPPALFLPRPRPPPPVVLPPVVAPPVAPPPAAPIINIQVPRFYRRMRKKAILYEHFAQRALDEPANARNWQRPVGRARNTLASLINVLATDDPTGRKGEAEVDRIRARIGKYPP